MNCIKLNRSAIKSGDASKTKLEDLQVQYEHAASTEEADASMYKNKATETIKLLGAVQDTLKLSKTVNLEGTTCIKKIKEAKEDSHTPEIKSCTVPFQTIDISSF